jgi:hypothetical protein
MVQNEVLARAHCRGLSNPVTQTLRYLKLYSIYNNGAQPSRVPARAILGDSIDSHTRPR